MIAWTGVVEFMARLCCPSLDTGTGSCGSILTRAGTLDVAPASDPAPSSALFCRREAIAKQQARPADGDVTGVGAELQRLEIVPASSTKKLPVQEHVARTNGRTLNALREGCRPHQRRQQQLTFASAGGGNGFPQVLGWDFAGIVESVGGQVSGFAPGERVLGFSPQPWSGIGALAELIAVPAGTIAAVPTGLDLPAAAALPVSGLTAMLTLNTAAVVSADAVLVVGATGGVGGFVTQLARARGAG